MRLYFYLKPGPREAIRAGKSMPARIVAAVQGAGWQVTLCPESERPDIPHRDGFHLVLNNDPGSDRCLVLRPAGFEPFWQIQPSNQRWDWDIAAKTYRPPDVAQDRIDAFVSTWRDQVLKASPGSGGGILVPLQGRLIERRSFQSASPLVMLHEVLRHWPDRVVTATLHPSERYSPEEINALQALGRDFPRLNLQPRPDALATADLVVTQNSTLAFKGFLLNKPAMLWARIDWHHNAASVPRDGMEQAFAQAEIPRDHGRYLFWYLRRQSLWAWDDNPKPILKRLSALGWPIAN